MEQNNQAVIEVKKMEQFLANINVLRELSNTKPNIETLKSYKGFGGLRQCFNSKHLYGMLMGTIRGVFGKSREYEVFNTLRHSCKSAYYTPKEVINFMYRYLEEVCEFTGGDILEPACGNGLFFEHMPDRLKANSKITGIEMDILTSKLTKCIYPNIEIINSPIQDIDFTDKKYDLIIGNPPYSDELMTDKNMPDLNNYTIHHYFTAKCMRLLKDNGILAFVLPSFYMDIPCKNTRAIIDNEAVFIDAIRLPENLFEQSIVTVDIIFIRKTGNKLHNFVNTVELKQGSAKDSINEFWKLNPHRILGELKLKWVEVYKRHVPTCTSVNQQAPLDELINYKFDANTKANFKQIRDNIDDTEDKGSSSYTSIPELALNPQEIISKFKFELTNLLEVTAINLPGEINRLIKLSEKMF